MWFSLWLRADARKSCLCPEAERSQDFIASAPPDELGLNLYFKTHFTASRLISRMGPLAMDCGAFAISDEKETLLSPIVHLQQN